MILHTNIIGLCNTNKCRKFENISIFKLVFSIIAIPALSNPGSIDKIFILFFLYIRNLDARNPFLLQFFHGLCGRVNQVVLGMVLRLLQ